MQMREHDTKTASVSNGEKIMSVYKGNRWWS